MTSTVVSVAQAHNKGIDLRAIAVGYVYNGPPPQAVVVVAPNSPIRNGAEREGRCGHRPRGSIASRSPSLDRRQRRRLKDGNPALAQGRIDAALLVEPFTSVARGQIKILGDPQAAIGRGYMVTVWYAKADWLDANRDTARRFVDVMLQTAKWANRNHDQSATILAKYVGLSADVIRATPRAIYGEAPITPAVIQPVLDFSTRYIGLDKTSAAALIWRAS